GQYALGQRLAAVLRELQRPRKRGAARLEAISRRRVVVSRKSVAIELAARRHPRRSLSRQRVLPRQQALRIDRLLFRLYRRTRLRRRDLPQRLVLRGR